MRDDLKIKNEINRGKRGNLGVEARSYSKVLDCVYNMHFKHTLFSICINITVINYYGS